jgi:hypothetical protein
MILDMKRMVIEMQRRGIAPLNAGVGTCIYPPRPRAGPNRA